MTSKQFTFVRVPAADGDALEERQLPVPAELEANLSCITSALQDYYRAHGGVPTEAGKEAMMSAVKERVQGQQGGAPAAIDPQMLSQLTMSQTVDIIQLLPAIKDTGRSACEGAEAP